MQTLIAPAINLLILVGILVYFLKTPLKSFVLERHNTIRTDLENVREQLATAKREYEEFSRKLASLTAEVAELRAQAAKDIDATRVRLIADAKRLAANIVVDARGSAEALYSELRGQLYTELSLRVLERAEAILRDRLTGDDRLRIRKEFSNQLESSQ